MWSKRKKKRQIKIFVIFGIKILRSNILFPAIKIKFFSKLRIIPVRFNELLFTAVQSGNNRNWWNVWLEQEKKMKQRNEILTWIEIRNAFIKMMECLWAIFICAAANMTGIYFSNQHTWFVRRALKINATFCLFDVHLFHICSF